jgi:hypothetical protein
MIDSNISAVNQIKSVKSTGFWYKKRVQKTAELLRKT